MSSTVDPFAELKSRQREMWASFATTAAFTTPVAAHLVEFAGIKPGETVLDVGTGQASSRLRQLGQAHR